ncbi:sensor histidine kinase [Streptomyces sp. AV19]|uniref:sensor histidine kinase n=1 Tax=Streptomyces sp. AV19 TaxID=2793068 RepID=UPI0018FE161E|nr:sensor histidine kinase [Streptomyces sp. AV19]MBH1934586.1 sensor histidine kinase [Streptomyces sp. AV19]MDG4530876.1 sensor histidine kinase [Streptomyces sp. AV19]
MGVPTRLTGWRGRSRIAQVDSYMRWTLYLLPFIFPLTSAPALLSEPGGGRGLSWLLVGLTLTQCVLGVGLLRRSLEHYRLERPAPWGRVICSGLLQLAAIVVVVLLVRTTGPMHLTGRGTTLLSGGLTFFGALSLLAARVRTYLLWCLVGGPVAGVAVLPFGGRPAGAVVVVLMVWFLAVWSLSTVRTTGWVLAVMWEAESARAMQARLAVAEERLRFARDVHDVLGRNLTVIALKSELAGQLARRGSPDAVEQMAEVQRIARDSQRDMREVVRGYREADLPTELAGARAVLGAAGIVCRVDDTVREELPPAVQSVLAWAVREGTTNVLRHAEAGRCAVRLRAADGRVELIMENDGVGAAASKPGSGGSGLAGLRERATALGGTLIAERRAKGTFRVTVKLPLVPECTGPECTGGTEPRAAEPPAVALAAPHGGTS